MFRPLLDGQSACTNMIQTRTHTSAHSHNAKIVRCRPGTTKLQTYPRGFATGRSADEGKS